MAGCTPQDSFFPGNECRIVLLGKTGAGKSSTGNSILGLKPATSKDSDKENEGFEVARGAFKSVTKTCKIKHGMRDNLNISVIDSPGMEDTDRKPEEIYHDIATTLTLVNPGPHVLLLVYKYGRFTDQDFKTYTGFKQLLGDNIKKYIIVIFTHVEDLVDDADDDLYEALTKEITENAPENLLSLLRDMDMRYFSFSNKAKGVRMIRQVDQLFQMIGQLMSANKWSYFHSPYTESLINKLKEMIAEKMMSPEEAKRKEEELQSKLEMAKRKEEEVQSKLEMAKRKEEEVQSKLEMAKRKEEEVQSKMKEMEMAKREEELQSKMKELEIAKQRDLEAKDRADREDMEKQLAQLNQTMLNLQFQQRNLQNEYMRSLLEEMRQDRQYSLHINVTQERGSCTVM